MTRAEKLARWTQLPFEIIKLLYTAEAVAGTRDWKTLESTTTAAGDRTALENAIIAWAFEEAERQAFILPLAIRISRVERERGRAKEDVAQLLTEVSDGVMQAVTNRAAGMMEFAILPDLVRIGEASAYVEAGVSQLGTALLVAPDLVLTSAHVVLDTDGNGSFIGTRLKPDLKFTFMPDRRDPSRTPVVRAALGTVPVAGALPHGRPPNILERNLNAAAAQNLDFALVRLSSGVTHVPWIDIKQPASAEKDRKCFVIGYPGGTALQFDVDLVTHVIPGSARMLHLANTIAGMSGSCCIGARGSPVGLHEGGFFKLDASGHVIRTAAGQEVVENNRAVCLQNIREALRALRPDPLVLRPRASGGGIHDPNLVVAWQRAGQRLAGATLEQIWNASVSQVLGANVSAAHGFHPWFKRKDLENWIDARTNSEERVAYVNGDAGAGKTFAVHILAAKLDNHLRDLVVLTPTQTSAWSWSDAVANLRRAGPSYPGLRTDVAGVKFEDVAPIIAALREHGGVDRTAENQHPLFFAIDFENAVSLKFDGTPWREFIRQLASQPWIRLLIIGLSESERQTLDAILQANSDTATVFPVQIDMRHADREELKQFLRSLYLDHGQAPTPATIDAHLNGWSNGTWLHGTQPQLQTAEAVLFALAAYNAVAASVSGGN